MAAAACNDRSVIDTFSELYVCGALLNCAMMNITSYKELKSLSNEEIRRRVNDSVRFEFEIAVYRNVGTSDAAQFVDYVKNVAADAYIGARTLLKSANAIAADYDQNIKRYACQANIQFDDNSLYKIALFDNVKSIDRNSGLNFAIIAGLQTNTGLSSIVNTLSNEVWSTMGRFRTTVLFTVQPKHPHKRSSANFTVGLNPSDALQ